ncbi:MAG: cyclase family protein [Thaumarchaeota archaeon]|nr:cyclase family protein [Nitrososphaerota archaeon]
MSLSFKKIVDLAVPMTHMNTPVYPGYPQPLRTTFSTVRDNGYESYVWTFVEHVSTHVDAPVHMVAGGATVDKMPLSHYIGNGVVLDFSKKAKRFQIKKADVEKAISSTGHSKEIGKGWIVLFHVNYTAKNTAADWLEHPDITKEAAEYLVSLGIEAVGIDAPGPDHPPFEAHKAFLPKQVVIFENLNNLDQLVGEDFLFVGTPIALAGGTAGITRPVALVR